MNSEFLPGFRSGNSQTFKNQKNIVLSVILYLRICSPHAIMETATLLSYDIDLLVHRSYQSMYRTLLES